MSCRSSILDDHLAITVGAVTWFILFLLVSTRISSAKHQKDGQYLFLESSENKSIFGLTLRYSVILIEAVCIKLTWKKHDIQGIFLLWTRINLEFDQKWIQPLTRVISPMDIFYHTFSLFACEVLWFKSWCPGPPVGTQFHGKGINCPFVLPSPVHLREPIAAGFPIIWPGN